MDDLEELSNDDFLKLRDEAATLEPPEEPVSTPAQKSLKDVPSDEFMRLRQQAADQSESVLAPVRAQVAKDYPSTPVRMAQAISFPRDLITGYIYGKAKNRLSEGNASEQDLRDIAIYEQEHQRRAESKKSIGGLLAGTAMELPSQLAGFEVGGIATRAAAPALGIAGAGAAPAIGRAALTTLATPNVGAQTIIQKNIEAGRDPLDMRGVASGTALGTAQMLTLGLVGKLTGKIAPEAGQIGQMAIQGVTGPIAQGVTDIVTSSMGLDAGFGTMGQLLSGNFGEAARHAMSQAMTFASLGGLHANPEAGKRIAEAIAESLKSARKSGLSVEAASRKAAEPVVKLEELMRNYEEDFAKQRDYLRSELRGENKKLAKEIEFDGIANAFEAAADVQKAIDSFKGPEKKVAEAAAEVAMSGGPMLGEGQELGDGIRRFPVLSEGQDIGGMIVTEKGKTLDLTFSADNPEQVGVGSWKGMVRQLVEHYPEATHVEFVRTTGPNKGKPQRLPIPKRKASAPAQEDPFASLLANNPELSRSVAPESPVARPEATPSPEAPEPTPIAPEANVAQLPEAFKDASKEDLIGIAQMMKVPVKNEWSRDRIAAEVAFKLKARPGQVIKPESPELLRGPGGIEYKPVQSETVDIAEEILRLQKQAQGENRLGRSFTEATIDDLRSAQRVGRTRYTRPLPPPEGFIAGQINGRDVWIKAKMGITRATERVPAGPPTVNQLPEDSTAPQAKPGQVRQPELSTPDQPTKESARIEEVRKDKRFDRLSDETILEFLQRLTPEQIIKAGPDGLIDAYDAQNWIDRSVSDEVLDALDPIVPYQPIRGFEDATSTPAQTETPQAKLEALEFAAKGGEHVGLEEIAEAGGLTPEETKTLLLSHPAGEGKSLRDVAKELGVSHQTVANRLESAGKKLGLKPKEIRRLIEEDRGQARAEIQKPSEDILEQTAGKYRAQTVQEFAEAELEKLIDQWEKEKRSGKLIPAKEAKYQERAARLSEDASGLEAPSEETVREHKRARKAERGPEATGRRVEPVPESRGEDAEIAAVIARDKEAKQSRIDLYEEAYYALKEFGITPQKLTAIARRGKRDADSVRGLDEVANDLNTRYGFARENETPSDVLFDILAEGKPKAIDKAEAKKRLDAEKIAAEEALPKRGDQGEEYGATDVGGFDPSMFGAPLTEAERGPGLGTPVTFGGIPGIPYTEANRVTNAPEQRVTALARAVQEKEREALGFSKLTPPERVRSEKTLNDAVAKIQLDPMAGDRLFRELEANPREATLEDLALLLTHKVALSNEMDRAVLSFGRLGQSGINSESARARSADLLDELNRLHSVIDTVRTQKGRELAFFRQLIAEDYSPAGMLTQAAAAKGSKLTEAEVDKVVKLSEEIRRLQSDLEAAKTGEKPAAPDGERGDMADLRIAVKKGRQKWDSLRGELKGQNQTPIQKAFHGTKEALNAARSLMTSMDFSAVLRQGGFLAFGNPLKASRAIPEMIRAFGSERAADRAQDALEQRPNFTKYKQAGLFLADRDGKPSAQEEAYVGKWVKRIPGIAGSERSYNTFLNRLRADVFDAMSSGTQAPEQRAIANFINVATGRGSLGTLENAGQALAQVFFSPRYVASRFQLLAGAPLWGGSAKTRQLVATEYAKTIIGIGAFYALMKAANDDAKITFDPRSSDFGKVQLGKTRIDPLTGLGQTAVFLSRLGSGQTKTITGKVSPIRGDKVPYGGSTVQDVISNFVRSKMAPVPGAAIDVLAGKNVVGEKTTPLKTAGNLATPIAVRDVYDALKDQGVPRGVAVGLLAILGMSTAVYEKRK